MQFSMLKFPLQAPHHLSSSKKSKAPEHPQDDNRVIFALGTKHPVAEVEFLFKELFVLVTVAEVRLVMLYQMYDIIRGGRRNGKKEEVFQETGMSVFDCSIVSINDNWV